MIKARVVYFCMAVLLLLIIVIVGILPNTGIETKKSEFSYETFVFNKDKVTTVNIEMAEEDWADMLENAAEEEYKRATVTINGKKIENVAIRTKGNLSLRSVVNSDSDRYSLKIDFDYYDNAQSLYGLKKLNLNNNYSDNTLMREYISYEIMESMGIPTPAHSYMYVTVNGEDRGLFVGVEQVDETFLANNFDSNDGFLFKPDGTGSDLKYISDDIADYTGIGLKTNEEHIDESKLIEMLDAINNGGDIEKYLDVDEMLRYFAVNTALVNLDSYQGNMKHNYYLYEDNGMFSIIPWDYNMSFGGFGVGGGGGDRKFDQSNQQQTETSNEESQAQPNQQQTDANNEEGQVPPNEQQAGNGVNQAPPNEQQAGNGGNLVPPNQQQADANNEGNQVQPNQSPDNNSNTGEMPEGDQQSQQDQQQANGRGQGGMDKGMGMSGNLINDSAINFSITTPVSGTTLEDRPLLNALLSNDEYRAKYESYLEEIATNYLTEDYVQQITNKLATLLTTYVEADPTKFSTTEQFLEAVEGENSLPEFANQRSESILKQLSGELVVEANTSDSRGNPNNMDMPDTNGNVPQDGNLPNQNNQAQPPENFDPSQLPADFDPSKMPQSGNNNGQDGRPNNGEMQPPGQNGGPMGMPDGNNEQTQATKIDKNTCIEFGISFILLIIALIFVIKFNRRGR